ncbi:FAD-dependent oxidoreductase [Desulfurococcaceae archaeon MEX13E-LK6-19]|nr:FAD-dependent oxidoreductase [Desulfurococcaceae archaeon MEX13E-LK6-19]
MKFLQCKLEDVPPKKHGRVAIIGSGPAGLGAAGYLICKGYEVHVYDMLPEPGGLLIFGAPEHHIPKEPVRKGVKELVDAGVVFHTSTKVICCREHEVRNHFDKILKKIIKSRKCLEDLVEEYDAVLIATGAWRSRRLGIPGEDLKGVYYALEWLVDFNLARLGYKKMKKVPRVKGRVLVIGGGLTAVDAVETPLRYLRDEVKEVYLSYRRTRYEAPMGKNRFEKLIKEYGIKSLELTVPIKFNGLLHVKEAVLQHVMLVPVGDGKTKPVPIPGTEFKLKVDTVLIAVGEKPSPPFRRECLGVKLNDDGTINVDEKYRTTKYKVFAAGDVKHGPSLIGPALKSGIEAAKCIEEFLTTKEWRRKDCSS